MACYHPLQAWRRGGQVVLAVPGEKWGDFELPCGKCIGCRLQRSREWAIRALHEAQMHYENSFVTLTYASDLQHSLHYPHFQDFIKRLREFRSEVRYFMCGEYGDKTQRPHYHAALFGCDFEDKELFSKNGGNKLYTSSVLEQLWGHGYCTIGELNFDTAAYIGRYCVKKINGDMAKEHYTHITPHGEIVELVPEFAHMSLKPGIGATWFEKYKDEVMNWDSVLAKGHEIKPPRYYDKLIAKEEGFRSDEIQYERYLERLKYMDDNTPERLAVRGELAKLKLDRKKRTL